VFVEADLAIAGQRPQIISNGAETLRPNRLSLFNNAGYSYLATLEQMNAG
jgi:hypothetical protein